MLATTLVHAQQFNEVALKARYLVGFSGFVRWVGEERPPPVSIGVMGDPLLFDAVAELARRQREAGRDLEARQLAPGDLLAGLDVLFVAKGSSVSINALLAEAARYNILTVGEASDFIDAGGMIEFVLRRNRLRFEVNLLATESNGMSLSSKLLRLAESTER